MTMRRKTLNNLAVFAVILVQVTLTAIAQQDEGIGKLPTSASNCYSFAKVKPLNSHAVAVTGGFWGSIRTRSRDVGVPSLLEQFEKNRHVEHFRICAAQSNKRHTGGPNCDEFFHKHMEAMGWYAGESQKIDALNGKLVPTILAAQRPDGYLNTYYENPLVKQKGAQRFAPMNRFEFYNFGHFTQAAIAHYRSTGKRAMLDGAIKFADLIVGQFASPAHLPYKLYRGKVNLKYEHPNHELAMVELYRTTNDRRYLDFVMQTLTEYGFFEDQHFNEMWGHAVQENLLQAGAADLYMETGRPEIWKVTSKLWEDANNGKTYIIGGAGSRTEGECYGDRHELPNAEAYAETCAAISRIFWAHKMLLATGEARYATEMERSLYNNVISGYGLDGKSYFYTNPLEWNPEVCKRPGRRFTWHHCPCCPPNLHRLFGSLGQYLYTQDNTGVQINLYAESTVTMSLPDGHRLRLSQKTSYPWSGTVELTMNAEVQALGTLKLRIPRWCEKPEVKVDGKPLDAVMRDGWIALDRPWALGKLLQLTLPMQARVVAGNPESADQLDRVAIERGPVVYCLEQADNPGLDFDRFYIPENAQITEKFEPNVLAGVVRLGVTAHRIDASGNENLVPVTLIPYYAWANRQPGRMSVWLPTKPNHGMTTTASGSAKQSKTRQSPPNTNDAHQ